MKFVLDVHCHTIASGHAYSTASEILERAKDIGLALVGISDHGPDMPDSLPLSHFLDIMKLPKIHNGMPWLKGVEANIIDASGKLDVPDEILTGLDFCIASVHESLFLPGDADANTAAVVGAMENPYVNIIGHLGDPRVPINLLPIITSAKRTNTLIEINNKSLIVGSKRYNGDGIILEILRLCKDVGAGIIAGSDAHIAADVGRLKLAKAVIKKSGIDERLVMNTNVERFLDILKGS